MIVKYVFQMMVIKVAIKRLPHLSLEIRLCISIYVPYDQIFTFAYLYLYMCFSTILFLFNGTYSKHARDWNIFLVKESPTKAIFIFFTVDKKCRLVNVILLASQLSSLKTHR